MPESQHFDLTLKLELAAPRSAIWRAWRDGALLQQWWTPAPVKTVSLRHDFRAGGAFATRMIMPDGAKIESEGCFVEVTPKSRIVFTDLLRGGWRPNPEGMFTASITLEDAGEGTLYSVRAMHRTAELSKNHADMGFEAGWTTAIRQLEALAQTLDPHSDD